MELPDQLYFFLVRDMPALGSTINIETVFSWGFAPDPPGFGARRPQENDIRSTRHIDDLIHMTACSICHSVACDNDARSTKCPVSANPDKSSLA